MNNFTVTMDAPTAARWRVKDPVAQARIAQRIAFTLELSSNDSRAT